MLFVQEHVERYEATDGQEGHAWQGTQTLILTTKGRRSGEPRKSPLACVPDGEGGWWVVGSNFGQESHPNWTGNLIADPNAAVSFEGKDTAVVAELLAVARALLRDIVVSDGARAADVDDLPELAPHARGAKQARR